MGKTSTTGDMLCFQATYFKTLFEHQQNKPHSFPAEQLGKIKLSSRMGKLSYKVIRWLAWGEAAGLLGGEH